MRENQPVSWFLLVYKVPHTPSSKRAFVWRKLKRFGALLLHDAIWVVPVTPYTQRYLYKLLLEIATLGGGAYLWEACLPFRQQENSLISQFLARVDALYQEILVALELQNTNLSALFRKYQNIHAQDYFHSTLGKRVSVELLLARKKTKNTLG